MIAAVALLAVVAASTVMERAATIVGGYFGVPGIVTGGLMLAVVTWPAQRGRQAASGSCEYRADQASRLT